ncbi:MAG: lamin tail domain-containing protein [Candidatus Eiseniibacteriota bacterium]|nr:MAG: lamin tail domain-containing protein [Candidatus Eisenbacteria bacterium]
MMGGGLFSLVSCTLFFFVSVFASLLAGTHDCQGSPAVVINEVLYDPEGPDDGLEFVELYNSTDSLVSLKGFLLETGNGAKEDDWKPAFEWGSDFFLEPGGFVVVGEEALSPPPDFVTPLDLQNGPDACRLRSGDFVVDLLGWGAHTFYGYFETAPAEDAPSGSSVGRWPDGADSDDNSSDFRPLAAPSPGRRNACVLDAGIVPGSLSTNPLLPLQFEQTEVAVEIENLGARELESGECVVEFFGVNGVERRPLGSRAAPAISGERAERVCVQWRPEQEGSLTIQAELKLEGDENPYNDAAASCVRVGEGDVVVNEIRYAPASGGPEWVELLNKSGAVVDLRGWWLEDSSRKRAYLSPLTFTLGPEEYVVVTQDRGLFLEQNPQCRSRVVEPEGGWITLNNYSSGGSEYADVVCVKDSTGCHSDVVAYSEDWSTRSGASLERVSPWVSSRLAVNWSSSVSLDGSTPCGPNSVAESLRPGGTSEIGMSSRVISPDGDGLDDTVVFSFSLPAHGAKVNFTIFDCDGRVVRRLIDRRKVGTVVRAIWDGTDRDGRFVPPAVYIVHLDVAGPGGDRRSLKSTVVVTPRVGSRGGP